MAQIPGFSGGVRDGLTGTLTGMMAKPKSKGVLCRDESLPVFPGFPGFQKYINFVRHLIV